MSTPLPVSEFLNPRSVAVIGASEDQGKFGGRVYRMLLHHRFPGTIYPINPNRQELFGRRTYPDVASTPTPADMMVLAIPQPKVKQAIAEAARAGVRGAVIITARFADAGPEGAQVERQLVEIARAHGMRLLGPNCLGVISPANNVVLCSSPALEVDRLIESPIGLVSQSGALMATLFDASYDLGIGFSHCVSVGNQADLELSDFLEFLVEDARTRVICAYVEGIKDPARFLAAADAARRGGKPLLMVKAGRTEAGSAAAYSHTASLAGSYASLAAVCREHGVVLMDDPEAMILLAACLARFPGRKVDRVAIVTTSGGGAAIAADRLTETGIGLAAFAPETRARLDVHYSTRQAGNPIDLGGRREGQASDVAFDTMMAVGQDPNTDLTLFLITTAPALPVITANLAEAALRGGDKPFLFVMEPAKAANASRDELRRRGLPFCNRLDDAVRAVVGWRQWSRLDSPVAVTRPASLSGPPPAPAGALGETEAKALLAAYGIPTNRGVVVADAAAAVTAARGLRFPLALKVVSPDIVHKSDVGGVALGLGDPEALRIALDAMAAEVARRAPAARVAGFALQEMAPPGVELIVGARYDPQFGPMLLVGSGGILVELVGDVAVAAAPVSPPRARQLLESLKAWALLVGVRGRRRADVAAACEVIACVSWLAADLGPSLRELDVNPLVVGENGVVVVDARALCEG